MNNKDIAIIAVRAATDIGILATTIGIADMATTRKSKLTRACALLASMVISDTISVKTNERITYLADYISAKFSHETTDDTEEG